MALTGQQKTALDAALRDAFRTRIKLARMLAYQCDRNLDDIAGDSELIDVVYKLVETADSEEWVDRLLVGALAGNPGNTSLQALYDSAWPAVAPQFPSRSSLQSLVEPNLQFLDVDQWLDALRQMSARICRVETTVGVGLGTGFLVGPSCVITNYHVLEAVLGQANLSVVYRFDFRLRPDGSERKGVTFSPEKAGKWKVASSPYSMLDFQVAPKGTPQPDQLDYAIVRLAGAPGTERGGSTSPARRWRWHRVSRSRSCNIRTLSRLSSRSIHTRSSALTTTRPGCSTGPTPRMGRPALLASP